MKDNTIIIAITIAALITSIVCGVLAFRSANKKKGNHYQILALAFLSGTNIELAFVLSHLIKF